MFNVWRQTFQLHRSGVWELEENLPNDIVEVCIEADEFEEIKNALCEIGAGHLFRCVTSDCIKLDEKIVGAVLIEDSDLHVRSLRRRSERVLIHVGTGVARTMAQHCCKSVGRTCHRNDASEDDDVICEHNVSRSIFQEEQSADCIRQQHSPCSYRPPLSNSTVSSRPSHPNSSSHYPP